MKTNTNRFAIEALVILFFIILLALTAKTQNTAVKKNNDTALTSMNKWLMNNEAKVNFLVKTYFQGVYDADEFYSSKKSGNGLIIASTLIGSPVLGLLPASLCSSSTPKAKNLFVPDSTLKNNKTYMCGYKSEARDIKRQCNWGCFVLASVVWTCLAIFVFY